MRYTYNELNARDIEGLESYGNDAVILVLQGSVPHEGEIFPEEERNTVERFLKRSIQRGSSLNSYEFLDETPDGALYIVFRSEKPQFAFARRSQSATQEQGQSYL